MKQTQQKRQNHRFGSNRTMLVSSQKSAIVAIILMVIANISTTTTTTKFVDAQLNIDGFPEACSDSLDQVLDCFRRNTQCAECAPGSGLTGFLGNFQPPLPPIDPTAGTGEGEDADTRRRNLVQQLRSSSYLQSRKLEDEEEEDGETSSSIPSDMPSMVPSDMPSLAPSQATSEDSVGEAITLSPDGTAPCPYVEDPLCPVVTCCFDCFGEVIELYKCWLYFDWELSEAALTAITQCPFLYDGSDTCTGDTAGGDNGGGENLFDIP
mmetsp:Transcript_10116/g.24350  ORF Transcript_10116/g.24350 Transcript_10116/m.24350 type:complete len:266 (+) Transcript_10116:183-980(+)